MNSSSNYNGKKKKTAEIKDDDGVDELLRAAQDDLLLKLSLNSHIARGTSSSLDPDLDSRFQALKSHQSKSKSKSKSNSNLDASIGRTNNEKKNPERVLHKFDESDDLFARFATLKGSSLPSHSNEVRQQLVNDDGEEDDEVDKVIKWAIDAARLDPSPPSDSDNDDEGDDDDDDGDEHSDDSDDEGVDHRKVDAGTKSKRK